MYIVKGAENRTTKTHGERLICSDMKRFCEKGEVLFMRRHNRQIYKKRKKNRKRRSPEK